MREKQNNNIEGSEQLQELKQLLLNDKIHYSKAYERLKKLPKPWHEKWWKEKRDSLIKTECERCGTKDGIMVLQHTKQPTDFRDIYDQVQEHYYDFEQIKEQVYASVTEDEIMTYMEENKQSRNSCPECGRVSVRFNISRQIYECNNGHSFDKPIKVDYYKHCRCVDLERAKHSARSNIGYKRVRIKARELRQKFDEIIGKEALLISIEESLEYRTLEHTKTCCKRCAAIEDGIVPEKRLCDKCKKNWHDVRYDMCLSCNQEMFKKKLSRYH